MSSSPLRSRIWPWALVLLAVVLVVSCRRGGDRVAFDGDIELGSSTVPHEVVAGGALPLTIRFRPTRALAVDEQVFVHVESEGGETKGCRMVSDAKPFPPTTRWTNLEIVQSVRIEVANTCEPGRLNVFAGLYNPRTGARLKVVEPETTDNRVLLAWTDVVKSDADASMRDITPHDMRLQIGIVLLRPWTPWLLGILAACAGTALLYRRRKKGDDGDDEEEKTSAARPLSMFDRRLSLVAIAVPFVLGILVVLEFVKDDAYITFRYAHNFVTGHGIVFNTGDRLEGYTNFLWLFVMAPFEALGWDLFQVCEWLGGLSGVCVLALVASFCSWINGERKTVTHLFGAVWLATSSSFVLWERSGMEQPLASLLPIAGAWLLFRARDRFAHDPSADERKTLNRRYLYAGLVMGAGCMTRPELHLLAILVGLPLVVDAARARKVTRAQWLYVAGILAVTVPCHTFRYAYYGSLIPNTFYVKTGGGSAIWHIGLRTLREMFAFNHMGLLAIVAPFAFVNRRRMIEKVTMVIISISFMIYYVNVGVDEMQWHRLYLPALPFLCVLATLGLQNVLDVALRALGDGKDATFARNAVQGLVWSAVLFAGWNNFLFTFREMGGFNGHGDLAGTYHPDMGKFLTRHERPGALVAFQDMGSTPYHSPDLNYLDFFGLTDRTVAHARHDHGLHTFIDVDVDNQQSLYDTEMRNYFFERNPEWTIFTIYPPEGEQEGIASIYESDPTGASFGPAYKENGVQFDLWDDSRFQERYVPVRTWPRSRAYYLVLFRRRDLWTQTPREVVLDAPPPGLAGAHATFEGGLELLGADTTKETHERHEAFVTSWWKLPGPLPKDLYFFIHLTKGEFQSPADHIPGDWMYPADRWKTGEILEDRTLVQLPPFTVKPGHYSIYIGAWRRTTGERLKVLNGPNDGQDRVLIGTLDVTPLRPVIQQLIPPTDVSVMRKYPDRIIDSHRHE